MFYFETLLKILSFFFISGCGLRLYIAQIEETNKRKLKKFFDKELNFMKEKLA